MRKNVIEFQSAAQIAAAPSRIGLNDSASKQGMPMPPERHSDVQVWPIDRLVFYARNPRKNDGAVDRMCGSIREFGFKIPCLIRSDGEVIDGHLRLKAARNLGS